MPPQIFYPEWFGHKKSNMKNQLKLIFQRNVGFDLERAQTSEHCFKELKQDITSLTITSPSLHHHFTITSFVCLFVYLRFVGKLVLLSTNLA